MRFRIIYLFFILVLFSIFVSADIGDKIVSEGKDKAMESACKSKQFSEACSAYSALQDPTGKLLSELGPQASMLISGIKDPLRTGKGAAISRIIESMPPETQAAFQFYDKFKGYLSQVKEFSGEDEVEQYKTDYEDDAAIVRKGGEDYFIVPKEYNMLDENTLVGAITGFVIQDDGGPEITFKKITEDTSKKPLQMDGYKILNSKKDTEITLKEYKDGKKELSIKNGEGNIEIHGKIYAIAPDKEGSIEYAEFTSKTKNKYNFNYNSIEYKFDVNAGQRLKFDPKNNIEANVPLNIKIPETDKTPAYNYDIKGDYKVNIKNGVPYYVDFKPKGSFCDNLKCDNLKVDSKKEFKLCIGEFSFKEECSKVKNAFGYSIDKDVSTYHSIGEIDYNVKETRINAKSNSETILAVGKEASVLNVEKNGDSVNVKHGGRSFIVDKNGDASLDVETFNKEYKIDKNFVIGYGDSNIVMTKKGSCSIYTKNGNTQCIDKGILNLIGAKEIRNKEKTRQLILERAIKQNELSMDYLSGGGELLAGFNAWTNCISRFKQDKCIKESEDILNYNNDLIFIRKRMESGESYESAIEKLKNADPEGYNRIKKSPLHEYLTKGIKNDGSISPNALTSVIPKYKEQAECSFLEGCDPGARLALASIGADNTLFYLNKPVYDAKGVLIGIPNSGIYSELTPINEILYNKQPINYKELERKIPQSEFKKHISEYPQLGSEKAVLGISGVKGVVQVLAPGPTPSGWDDYVKNFRNLHENAKKGVGPVPVAVDANGNYLFYSDIKDKLDDQTELFNEIKNINPHLFGLIDENYKLARSDESVNIYEYVTPLDVATIITPTTALKGLKFAKVLVRTEKGARLSLVGDAFKTLKLGSASRIGAVTELVEARTSLSITDDLIKSGLIRCASPCTLGDIKILLTKANVEPNRINEFEKYIKTDKGLDRLRLRNGLGQNLDLVKKSVVNSNDLQDLKSIKAVLEDIKETGFPSNFPNKNALNDIDNFIKEISIKEKKIKQDLTVTIDFTDEKIFKKGIAEYNIEKTYDLGDKGTLSFIKIRENYFRLYTTNKAGVSGAIEIPETGNIDELIEYVKLDTKLDVEKTIYPNKIRIKNIGNGKDLIITIEIEKKVRAIGGYLKYGKITDKKEVTSLSLK